MKMGVKAPTAGAAELSSGNVVFVAEDSSFFLRSFFFWLMKAEARRLSLVAFGARVSVLHQIAPFGVEREAVYITLSAFEPVDRASARGKKNFSESHTDVTGRDCVKSEGS